MNLKFLAYMIILVDTNRNFLQHFLSKGEVVTTGEDNLKTLQLVYSAYESAKINSVIKT